MSEEEKQAIETMQTIVDFGGDSLLCREHRERLQTVLNLIRKLQDKIKELNQEIEDLHSQIDDLMED